MPKPVHWSLGYFKASGDHITVYCPNGHGARVDLARAIDRFGADFLIVPGRQRFLAAYRCSHPGCGKKAHDLIISPGNTGPPN